MRGIVIAAVVVVLLGLLVWRALRNVPTCTCGDEECGGGCIARARREEGWGRDY